jgi:hypothetical protein
MRTFAAALALSLLLSGCSLRDVNEYSLIKYKHSDGAGTVALKSAGNLVPWSIEAAFLAAAAATVGAFIVAYAYIAGEAASKGIETQP